MVSRTSAFRALLLASAGFVPIAAAAQPVSPPAAQPDAIRVLLDQAQYWNGIYQYDKADDALQRVLAADPRNADALALEAQSAADRGNQQKARSALAALRAVRPDDPRIDVILQASQVGPIDQATLTQARSLATANKPDEAVAAYHRVFRGDTPPPNLATEYYQTLAATDGGWDAGRAGLANLLHLNPDNLRAQLAYAELLTYHDDTRIEGIQRLEVLVKIASIADQANKDLRQALTWLPVTVDNAPLFERYIADHPGDTDLQQRAQEAKNDTSTFRINGFDAMQADHFDDAERDFNQALSANSQDSDSMVGLALVRLHQRRVDDARSLLRQAVALDPTKADTYQSLLNGTGNTNSGASQIDYGAIAARRIRSEYAQVAALTQHGRYADAERRLRGLIGRRPTAANRLQLADIQARGGNLPEAEASYRSVLAVQPRNAIALGGLAGVLTREGKLAEADTLFARAEASGGGASIGRTRALALQQQAEQVSDPVARTGLFRAAVAADPSNPWLRLALARGLLAQDRQSEADQVMAGVAASPKPSTEQLQAGIYYYNETHNLQQASALISHLPPKARTGDMQQIQTRATLDGDLREARSAGSLQGARYRLLQAASRPDPTGIRGSEISAELVRLGDKRSGREAIRLALAASHPVTSEQRLAYAGALLGAGYPNDAKIVTSSLPAGRLSPLQASRLATLQDSTAVYSADNLNNEGKAAEAYDELAPRLAANPTDPDLNMALSRVYETNKKPRQALAINEELLRQNPDSLSVRRSTIGAALAAGAYGRARELADQTMAEFPNEPEAWMAAAAVAQARSEDGLALRDLRTARRLRRQQLATQPSPAAQAEPSAKRLVEYAQNIPSDVATDAPSDAWSLPAPEAQPAPALVTRQYAQYAPDPSSNLPIEGGTASFSAPPASLATPPASMLRAPTLQSVAARAVSPVPMDLSTEQPSAPATTAIAQATPLGLPPSNPFRAPPTGAPLIDEPSQNAPDLLSGTAVQAQSTDPLTQEIDRNIAQVSENVAPSVEASLGIRGRSGDDGLGKLLEVTSPVEASYSPNGYGRLTVQVTPTYLYAGKASSNSASQFGTNALAGTSVSSAAAPAPRPQTAGGSAVDLKYAYDIITADVGTTPLGFEEQNVVGGIEVSPRIGSNFALHLSFDRRAVEDSLLSFAGTRDVRSGEKFGGVTLNRVQARLDGSIGPAYVYANVGGGYLWGDNVEENSEVNAGLGFSYPVYSTSTQEVRVGTDLIYYNYDKNLEGFTLGQGGYFSPQNYFAALFPVNYRQQVTPDLVFNIGGSVGFQTFNQKSEAIFPNNATLQSQLVAAAHNSTGVLTTDPGGHFSGIAGGAHADIDYRLTPNFHIGATAGFDHAGDFTEGTGLVYARYVFDDMQ